MIQSSWTLDGCSARVSCGAARLSTSASSDTSMQGSARTARPAQALASARIYPPERHAIKSFITLRLTHNANNPSNALCWRGGETDRGDAVAGPGGVRQRVGHA